MKKLYALLILLVSCFYFSNAQTPVMGVTSSGGATDTGGTIFRINLMEAALLLPIHLIRLEVLRLTERLCRRRTARFTG